MNKHIQHSSFIRLAKLFGTLPLHKFRWLLFLPLVFAGLEINALTTEDCCDLNSGKPNKLTLLYTGQGCSATNTTQSTSKYSCGDVGGGPNGASSVYIVASSGVSGSGKIYFSGNVAINSTFVASSQSGGDSSFPSNTYFTVYASQGGAVLQNVKIHTSCSAPIVPGEQFGSLKLLAAEWASGAVCGSPVPPETCPVPTITVNVPGGTNNTTVCAGEPIVFSTEDLGFPCIEYKWNFGPNATPATAAGIGPHTVTYSVSGNVQVKLTIDNDCEGGTGTTVCTQAPGTPPGICFKVDPPVSGSSYGVNYTVTNQGGEPKFLTVTGSDITSVEVKGGPGSKIYTNPPFTNLTAPINPANGQPYGISHFTICKSSGGSGGSSGSDCCKTGGDKPKSLTLKYNGQSCANSNNTQGSKASCANVGGGPNGAANVYIVAAEKENGSGQIYFTGNVALNSNFTATATGNEFKSNTWFLIYANQGGALLQKIKIHTSCSAPIIPGQQFGSLVIQSVIFKNNYSCGPVTPPGPDCIDCEATATVNISVVPCQPVLGKIGDFVWYDLNGNGIQDQGEPGIPAVFVVLETCAGAFVSSTFTNGAGMYMFNDLPAGSYRVIFSNPNTNLYAPSPKDQGNDDTKDSDAGTNGQTDCFTLGQGETNLTIDAGFKPAAPPPCNINLTIANIVCDGKGTSDTSDDTYTFTVTATGTGTSNAYFLSFSNACIGVAQSGPHPYNTPIQLGPFPAGNFVCGVTVPPIIFPNGLDIQVSAVDAVNGNCSASTVVLSPGPCSPPSPAAIGDFVWNDLNQNGQQDFGEPGVGGVTVRLFLCDGTFVAQTVTSGTGFYSFTNLTPNQQYFVEFSNLPSGFVFTTTNAAPDNVDSDANQANGRTGCYFLSPGENNTTVDAGIFQPAPVLGSIGDFVWNDLNQNGIQDTGEPGVANVTVRLRNCSNAVLAVTTTNFVGFYEFTGLAAGCYRVSVDLPLGFQFSPQNQGGDPARDSDINPATSTTANINLGQGENNPTIDAGIYQPTQTGPAKIGDFVWFDTNANGIQDPGELGIPNIFVILENCAGGFVNFAVTDANGMYMFNNVAPGNYRIKFANPGNVNGVPVQFTVKDAGNDDTKDSDADWLGFTDCFTVNPGDINLTIDAGLTGEAPPPVCNLNANVSNVVCNNNGTPANPNDDTFTFSVVVTGSNTGNAGYKIPALNALNLQYGVTYNFGPFPISGGGLNLIARDNTFDNCTVSFSVQAPAPCSTGPEPCLPTTGVLKPTATPVNLVNGTANISAFHGQNPFVPSGYQVIYVLTGQNLVILATNNTPSFTVNAAGTYKIHTLVYNPATLNLGIIQLGVTTATQVNALLIQGGGSICAALDLVGATIVVNPPTQTCNNVSNGGTIGYDETQCQSYDPAPIVSLTLPTGGSGAIEYVWLASTTGCPSDISNAIPNSNSPTYDPPFITQTTWYRRCARRVGCTEWIESNCVKKEVCPPTGGCNITFTGGQNSITIGGLNDPNVDVKIFNSSWAQVFACFNNCSNPTVVTLPKGTYYVNVQMWNSNWQPTCNKEGYVTVTGNLQDPGTTGLGAPGTGSGNEKAPSGEISERNATDTDASTITVLEAMRLFPNPASGYAVMEWPGADLNQPATIILLNQLGQVVRSIKLDDASVGTYRMELSDLKSGQYMVQFRLEGKAPVVKKLVVTH